MVLAGTVVFDGDCGFCTWSARHLERMGHGRFDVLPWQWADLAALGLTADACSAAVQFVGPGGRGSGAQAIALALLASPQPWRTMGVLLDLPPVRPLAAAAYRVVARNRHRLPGGTAACAA